MIARLLGFDLAGPPDPGLRRAAALATASALCEAAGYALLVHGFFLAFEAEPTTGDIALVTLGLLAAFLGGWLCKSRALLASFTATYATVTTMRLAAADRLGAMPAGTLLRRRGATLADLFVDRFSLYQDIVTHIWWQAASTLILPFLLWLVLLFVDWRLALVPVAFLPLAIATVPWSFRLLDRATDRVLPVRDDCANRVVELAEGFKDIQILDPGGSRQAAARAAVEELERRSLATELAPAPAIFAFGLLWAVALAAAVLAAAWLWSTGGLRPVAAAAGLVLAARLCAGLGDIGTLLVELRFARRILTDIREFMAQPTLPAPAVPREPRGPAIELSNVDFAYAGEPTITGLSLAVPPGAMLALVGPSGSGKTTVAGLIARLWEVDGGAVRIGGVDVREMTAETLNRTVSMVLQDVSLFPMSIRDNIRLGRPEAPDPAVEEAARAARIHERILQLPLGYDTVLADSGTALSGGERQRLAIARAIVKQAPVLVLDEATASIDLENEWQIQEALEVLARDRTVVVIAHRLWTIAAADRIVVLDRGRAAETGTHAELLAADGLYAAMWRDQRAAAGWRIA